METRKKISVVLIAAGIILALLPLRETRSLHGSPPEILNTALSDDRMLTPDQLARLLVSGDSLLNLIDLRPAEEFLSFSIPGAINIPYESMLSGDPSGYLGKGSFRNVFYSNSDLKSAYAVVIAAGLGYDNCQMMSGGLNGWIESVMNSSFSGERISARENALFETRLKARRMFSEFNSLPDSLKERYLGSKKFERKKLDGGCE